VGETPAGSSFRRPSRTFWTIRLCCVDPWERRGSMYQGEDWQSTLNHINLGALKAEIVYQGCKSMHNLSSSIFLAKVKIELQYLQ
jgi:hypothetical protein